MYDKTLITDLLSQIKTSLNKIKNRSKNISSAEYFTATREGEERLDGICMLFLAVGESLKKIDKITEGNLLKKYPGADWIGAKGFRDVIAHQYFDIDADEIFGIIQNDLDSLIKAIDSLIDEFK
jgi:uncharacterized protein with HEPN domain